MANFHIVAGAGEAPAHPVVRKITPADLKEALAKGFDDFWAMPSHLVFLGLIYPVVGVCLAALTFSNNALPLLYPLASGFALIGPFAGIGLYEISRRRELGLSTSWQDAFNVLKSPSIPSIIALGVLLLVIFLTWLTTARLLYQSIFGYAVPTSYADLVNQVLTTSEGMRLIVLGNILGFIFAVAVLSISVISFPLLLDRDVGAAVAVYTSIKAVAMNPLTMALWGLIVAAALLVGSIPLFVGLAIVMPVLGHATWHLYRRVVEPPHPDEAHSAR
ncbi:DUF2189 domain-containing protein [Microvirga sp. 3-52]|jgi:uncharacterized membrane protein|uniref:DUF2189 domain-containing protein n=1 Tax=Microvirga sp. 3-52 TaxID=2792425 RepID=UPI001AC34B74|nr:DUF2189 domain-containing protein [Microvirga sp. 3-52]MBO1903390.1 DUF2189 domain-containing protein [Microvirga sp. 3-52]MBS7451011.1 DUF2189 domain-containing protein [Microvirga sp. 3-52]